MRIVEFLVLDQEFPRAVHYCVNAAEESLRAISGTKPGTFRNPAEQQLGRISAELHYTQVRDIIACGLHEFMDDLQVGLNRAGGAIHNTFFALQPIPVVPHYAADRNE